MLKSRFVVSGLVLALPAVFACGGDVDGGGGGADAQAGADENAPSGQCAGVAGDGEFSKGQIDFTINGKTFSFGLGLSTLSEDHWFNGQQTGLGTIDVGYKRCYEVTTPYEGTAMMGAHIRVPSKPGTYPLVTKVEFPGLVDTPSISISIPRGEGDAAAKTYEAGFNMFARCNPCGSGSITVSAFDFDARTASGSFEFTGVATSLTSPPDAADTTTVSGTFTVMMK